MEITAAGFIWEAPPAGHRRLFLSLLLRIRQRHNSSFRYSRDHGLAFGAAHQFDIGGREARAGFGPDKRASVAVENRLARHRKYVVESLRVDHQIGVHPGPQLGSRIVECYLALEMAVPGRTGGSAHIFDVPMKPVERYGHDLDFDRFTRTEVPTIQFPDVGTQNPAIQIGDLGDDHARVDAVPHAKWWQRHSAIAPVDVRILADRHISGAVRVDGHALDVAARRRRLHLSFAARCVLNGDARLVRRFEVGHVLL